MAERRWISDEEFESAWRRVKELSRFEVGDKVGISGTTITAQVIAVKALSVWVKTSDGDIKEFSNLDELINFREH